MKKLFTICTALAVVVGLVAQTVPVPGGKKAIGPLSSAPSNAQYPSWNATTGMWDPTSVGAGTSGNWGAVGTTNSALPGGATANYLTATGAVTAASVNASGLINSATMAVNDDAYDATAWNGSTNVPTKNAVRDKIESLGAGGVDDTAFASSWNGVTGTGPSKNAVYDWAHIFDTDDDGKVNVLDQSTGIANTDASGVIQTPITTSAGMRGALSDESGSGALLFAGGDIGAATGTSLALSGAASSASLAVSGNATIGGSVTVGGIDFGTTLSSDDTYAGIIRTGFNNSGGVTQWDAVYLNSSSQWVLADANGSGTYPAQGIAVATVATGNATTVLTRGTIRNDAWNWTVGGLIYLSTTAGGLTQTPPGAIGDKIQVMGYALNADTMAVQIGTTYETVGDKYFEFALSDETTAITTGTAKLTWRAPFAFTVKDLRASLATVSSSGIPTVDINEAGTTIISTKLTIDANEKTSTTAAAAYVLSDSSIADDAEITFDIDVAGTGATGLKVKIYYTKP